MIFMLLFIAFFVTGLISVGGGLATIPFLEEMSVRFGWFSLDELSNMIGISESTPGAIGINVATYAGNKTAGILGGVMASLALVLGPFLLLMLILPWLEKRSEHPYVRNLFKSLRSVSCALIASSFLRFFIQNVPQSSTPLRSALLFLTLALAMLRFKKLHPIVWMLSAGVFGMILTL